MISNRYHLKFYFTNFRRPLSWSWSKISCSRWSRKLSKQPFSMLPACTHLLLCASGYSEAHHFHWGDIFFQVLCFQHADLSPFSRIFRSTRSVYTPHPFGGEFLFFLLSPNRFAASSARSAYDSHSDRNQPASASFAILQKAERFALIHGQLYRFLCFCRLVISPNW